MGITISSKTLHELNEAVDNLQNGLSPPHLSLHIDGSGQAGSRASDLEEWNFHLQLVLDIISKAPILVVSKKTISQRKKKREKEKKEKAR